MTKAEAKKLIGKGFLVNHHMRRGGKTFEIVAISKGQHFILVKVDDNDGHSGDNNEWLVGDSSRLNGKNGWWYRQEEGVILDTPIKLIEDEEKEPTLFSFDDL
jgi:hypothetical protein